MKNLVHVRPFTVLKKSEKEEKKEMEEKERKKRKKERKKERKRKRKKEKRKERRGRKTSTTFGIPQMRDQKKTESKCLLGFPTAR